VGSVEFEIHRDTQGKTLIVVAAQNCWTEVSLWNDAERYRECLTPLQPGDVAGLSLARCVLGVYATNGAG
jgi:hypothetical protein